MNRIYHKCKDGIRIMMPYLVTDCMGTIKKLEGAY